MPAGLPAIAHLEREGIGKVGQEPGRRSLRIGILNLMPVKETTETDLLRLLSASPAQVEVAWFEPATHRSKTTAAAHLERFYSKLPERIEAGMFDGFIVTGAPVEKLAFEDVDYWRELTELMDSLKKNVRSTLYICWAAFAGLYHHHGISKKLYDKKISGVFPHRIVTPAALTAGFDDEFHVPHSRFAGLDRREIASAPGLAIVSESDEAGVYIVGEVNGRDFYITGHSEYSPLTLDSEYRRDLAKGMEPEIPANYYPDDDPGRMPVVRWRAHSRMLFDNWLNHYVSPSEVCGLDVRF